jgi:meiotically up-regulated gene 157 (Mug157) protein
MCCSLVERAGTVSPPADATTYRFLVPANAYAVVSLRQLATLLRIPSCQSSTREVRVSTRE